MTEPRKIDTRRPPLLTLEPVTPVSNHDGDTFTASFRMDAILQGAKQWEEKIRLAHVNAPELRVSGKLNPVGVAARDAVAQWLIDHSVLRLDIWGREKYGRLLADAIGEDEKLSDFVAGLTGSKPMHVHEAFGNA